MQIKLDLPAGIFDETFREEDFAGRVREVAILELIRARRIHEHEAQSMLKVERWELTVLMEQVGIAPTEKVFEDLKGELARAIVTLSARR
jgi:hypothetical protein